MEGAYRKVAQIVGVFGLKGQLKVRVMTDFLERFEPGAPLRLDGQDVSILETTPHGNKLLIRLDGLDDVEAARKLQFHYFEAPAEFHAQLAEDEYRTEDLIGLEVFTIDSERLGIVDDVLAGPAHDVIVVGEIMVPAVKEFVKDVDLPGGRIVVKLIEGMRPE